MKALPLVPIIIFCLSPLVAFGSPLQVELMSCPAVEGAAGKPPRCISLKLRDQSRLMFRLMREDPKAVRSFRVTSHRHTSYSHISRIRRAELIRGRNVKVFGGWTVMLSPDSAGMDRRFVSLSILSEPRKRLRNYEIIINCRRDSSRCVAERFHRSASQILAAHPKSVDFLHSAPAHLPSTPANPRHSSQAVPAYSLTIDADSRFTQLYGDDTADVVAVILQELAEIFLSQLGVMLRLDALNIFPDASQDPLGAEVNSAVALLDSYNDYVRSLGTSTSDHNHLLTARRGFNGAIGLAYLGATCQFPNFNAGWSEYSFGFRTFVQTFAHELGHSLGATHDTTDPRGLMSIASSVNIRSPYFSDFSRAEISSFLGSMGACLNDDSGAPLPTPGAVAYPLPGERAENLSLSVRTVRRGSAGYVRGNVSARRAGIAIANRVIELRKVRGLKLVRTTQTTGRGNFSFRVSPRGHFYVVDRLARKASPGVRF